MAEFLIEFVLEARRFDARGLRYHQELSRVDAKALLDDLVRTRFNRLNGGYCLVEHGRVWNALGEVEYAPDHVYCQVDNTNMAHLVLDNVLMQLEDDRPVQTLFLESVTMDIVPQAGGVLRIAGNTVTGSRLFREIEVPIGTFFQQLHKATTAFVAFAQGLAGLIQAETRSEVVQAAPALLGNLGLERWQADLERLTAACEQLRQQPGTGSWRR